MFLGSWVFMGSWGNKLYNGNVLFVAELLQRKQLRQKIGILVARLANSNCIKKEKPRRQQAVKTTPHWSWGKVSHFGTEYRKTPLPADKKGPVREVQQSTRRRKEVTKRLEYQPQTSKSTRHRHCRAKLRVYRDDHSSRPLPIHKNYRVS